MMGTLHCIIYNSLLSTFHFKTYLLSTNTLASCTGKQKSFPDVATFFSWFSQRRRCLSYQKLLLSSLLVIVGISEFPGCYFRVICSEPIFSFSAKKENEKKRTEIRLSDVKFIFCNDRTISP